VIEGLAARSNFFGAPPRGAVHAVFPPLELQAVVSHGYARGKFEPVPRDRKDWYD
jgi:hypothetical protein